MDGLMDLIKNRRAIRHFQPEQLRPEELEQILEAGLWAPSAGGRQSAVLMVCQDAAENEKIGSINRSIFGGALPANAHEVNGKQISIAEDGSIRSAFYGAPTVVALFAPSQNRFGVNDCMAAAENMLLMAWSLGVGSVFVGRAEETFSTEEGRRLMERAGIGPDYTAGGFVCLGYPDGDPGQGKPRHSGRVRWV